MPVLVCLFISWDIGIYKSRRDVVSAAILTPSYHFFEHNF